jgi:hypothetical protein
MRSCVCPLDQLVLALARLERLHGQCLDVRRRRRPQRWPSPGRRARRNARRHGRLVRRTRRARLRRSGRHARSRTGRHARSRTGRHGRSRNRKGSALVQPLERMPGLLQLERPVRRRLLGTDVRSQRGSMPELLGHRTRLRQRNLCDSVGGRRTAAGLRHRGVRCVAPLHPRLAVGVLPGRPDLWVPDHDPVVSAVPLAFPPFSQSVCLTTQCRSARRTSSTMRAMTTSSSSIVRRASISPRMRL